EVRVWREVGQVLHLAWQAHTDNTFALAFSPDEHTLASGSHDGSVKLWDVASGALLWSGWQTKAPICLAFAPDGSRLASASHDGTIKLWQVGEARSGRLCQTLVGHTEGVQTLAWSPDGGVLASGGLDHTIRMWEGEQRSARAVLQGHSAAV